MLDLTLASEHIACLKHRPNYNCQSAAFRSYERGALKASCSLSDSFRLELFSRDHLRDIFDGLVTARTLPAATVTIEQPVLLVTRENTEYANLFHAMSDVINAFGMLYVTGVPADSVRVLLLDDHPEGPYDIVWRALSRGGPLMRLTDYEGDKVCISRLAETRVLTLYCSLGVAARSHLCATRLLQLITGPR